MTMEQRLAISYCARTTYTEHKRLAHDRAKLGLPHMSALLGMRDAVVSYRVAWPETLRVR